MSPCPCSETNHPLAQANRIARYLPDCIQPNLRFADGEQQRMRKKRSGKIVTTLASAEANFYAMGYIGAFQNISDAPRTRRQ